MKRTGSLTESSSGQALIRNGAVVSLSFPAFSSFFVTIFLCFFLFLPDSGRADDTPSQNLAPVLITRIDIEGNRKIDTGTIRQKIHNKVGDPFSQSAISSDLKSLYQTGYFDQIQVYARGFEGGVALTFVVTERPTVEKISFVGNNNQSDSDLRKKLTILPASFYDGYEVHQNVRRIEELYRKSGYYNASVVPVTRRISNRKVELIFLISEGTVTHITKVSFSGNKAYSASTLQKKIKTKPYNWLTSWWTDSGIYKKSQTEEDIQRLRDFYLNHGYINIAVGEPRRIFHNHRKTMEIRFPLTEGDQFRIAHVGVSGNTLFGKKEILKAIKTKPSQIFSRKRLQKDINNLTRKYGHKGYAFAIVTPQIVPNIRKKTVNLTFLITEGGLVHIRKINIAGNELTRDKVIRRVLGVQESGIMDTQALQDSYRNLNNLNFFKNVQIVPQQVGDNLVDLNVKVKEKPTGTFSIGGGYSTLFGVMGMATIAQNNIFGTGDSVSLSGELGGFITMYSLTITDPYFMDTPTAASLSFFDTFMDYFTYWNSALGGSLSLTRRFGYYFSTSLSWLVETEQIFLVAVTPQQAQEAPVLAPFLQQVGYWTQSGPSIGFSYDRRDNYMLPHRGYHIWGNIGVYGGTFGGDTSFYQATGNATVFFPITEKSTLSFHFAVGYENPLGPDGFIPVWDRFYVGGIYSNRGYNFGFAGPMPFGYLVGGDKELIFNADYVWPIFAKYGFYGDIFFDNSGEYLPGQPLSLSGFDWPGTGIGIMWNSPMGPLTLDLGWPLANNAYIKGFPGNYPGPVVNFEMGSLYGG
ncbi:MAG: outer membrane protein assembly factor BamA [Nitrospirae bacterium]|nr:outer membrane protein assembly factor BamA [Nitrospirota bacterium]